MSSSLSATSRELHTWLSCRSCSSIRYTYTHTYTQQTLSSKQRKHFTSNYTSCTWDCVDVRVSLAIWMHLHPIMFGLLVSFLLQVRFESHHMYYVVSITVFHLYDFLKHLQSSFWKNKAPQQLPDWLFCRFHRSSWPPFDAIVSIQATPGLLPSSPTPQHWPLFLLWSICKNTTNPKKRTRSNHQPRSSIWESVQGIVLKVWLGLNHSH